MTKKIFLILGIVVIAGGVAYFVLSQNSGGSGDSGAGGFSLRNFFPFGDSGDATTTPENQTGDNENEGATPGLFAQQSAEIPALRKISSSPVAGMVISNTGTTSIVRFVEKATGNVYEARSNSLNIRRLTNTTIPKIIRVFWLPSNKGFLAQTADAEDLIETSYVELKDVKTGGAEPSVPYESLISKLPTGIKEISVSPDSKKIIYYKTDKGVSEWFVSNPDGTSSKIVYQNNLTEWIPQWFSANSVLMTTKASSKAPSFGYVLNVSNGQTSKVFGGIAGASANMSPDGKYLAVSEGGENSVSISVINTTSVLSNSIGARTLAEKCVWQNQNSAICAIPKNLPNGKYPDSWYQGVINTEDVIGLIDAENSTYSIIEILEDNRIDVEKIVVSKDGRYASFVDKKDSSLWLLKIKD